VRIRAGQINSNSDNGFDISIYELPTELPTKADYAKLLGYDDERLDAAYKELLDYTSECGLEAATLEFELYTSKELSVSWIETPAKFLEGLKKIVAALEEVDLTKVYITLDID
jgi:hypothetical protein